jgi:hypothetical protein
MQLNFIAILAAAVVPLLLGYVWYNPKVFGNAWMASSGITMEKAKSANMGIVFLFSFLFNLMIAFMMNFIVIHQMHFYSILMNEPGFKDPDSPIQFYIKDFMSKYGNNFRTFKHGMLHGFIAGLFLALPVVGTNALFEMRGLKYIAITAGYWIISFMLMGGIICQFN